MLKPLPLLQHQLDVMRDDKTPILGLCSGYGGGKTFIAARKAVDLAIKNPGYDGIITEPNFPLLQQIMVPELEAALSFFGIPFNFSKSEGIFYCVIGGQQTRIICKSLELYDRLIGINAAWVIMDEFDTTKSKIAYTAFLKLLGRIRVGGVNQMVIVSTPEGFGAMYKIFVIEAKDDDRTKLIRARTTDNHHLPESYITLLQQTYPKNLLQAYMYGEFVNLVSGSVYPYFDRKHCHTDRIIRKSEPLHIGMDFNINNMAAVVFVVNDDGTASAVDELIGHRDTPEMIRAIKQRYEGHAINIYPDSSGKKGTSTNASVSDIALLREASFAVHARKSNPRVKDRVNCVNARLDAGIITVNTITCPDTTQALEQQCYTDAGEPDKDKGHDHPLDAFGYFVIYNFALTAMQPDRRRRFYT